MLSIENNELLTRVGPGTRMGAMMRQYWVPAMLSSELPAPDCDPVRVMLLGERLVAFRDTEGRVGLLSTFCPHRRANLFYGRNEESGLRCVYHGWKFDVHGSCVDMPNEPPDSSFRHKVKAPSYPCVERGGVVWTYMGPEETPPMLPDFEANVDGGTARAVLRECNWLQALEGDVDTCHVAFLHMGAENPEDYPEGTFTRSSLEYKAPKYAVLDTPFGVMYAAYRPFGPGKTYWRIGNFSFPFYTQPGPGTLGAKVNVRAWVPIDDTHTMFFMMWPTQRSVQIQETEHMLPNSSDYYGRFRLAENPRNDHLIDRDLQRSGEDFMGILGIHTQDQAITESMDSIVAREAERLGSSDLMIARVRRRLINAVNDFVEKDVVPPGVLEPGIYRTRSGGIVLDNGVDWLEATKELRDGYTVPTNVDRSRERNGSVL